MNNEKIEGATQKGVGAIKDATGKVIGNDKLRAEGLADKVAGESKEQIGRAKDAVHKATK